MLLYDIALMSCPVCVRVLLYDIVSSGVPAYVFAGVSVTVYIGMPDQGGCLQGPLPVF